MTGHYEVKKVKDGWRWALVGGNGEPVAGSETYTRREDAFRGIHDAKQVARDADTAEIVEL